MRGAHENDEKKLCETEKNQGENQGETKGGDMNSPATLNPETGEQREKEAKKVHARA